MKIPDLFPDDHLVKKSWDIPSFHEQVSKKVNSTVHQLRNKAGRLSDKLWPESETEKNGN